MAYFKIGNNDYSKYVNKLVVNKTAHYNAQTNAAGNTVVDYINAKRTIEVGIVPLDAASASLLLADIDRFNVSLSFLNPITNTLEENVNCIIPETGVDYYTIQADKVMLNAFTLEFTEL